MGYWILFHEVQHILLTVNKYISCSTAVTRTRREDITGIIINYHSVFSLLFCLTVCLYVLVLHNLCVNTYDIYNDMRK